MALSDPELDLLRELLADDPAADVFLDVGRELVRREANAEAIRVLGDALEHHPGVREGWELLARAAMAEGQYLRALAAVEALDPDPEREPALVGLHLQALEGSGQTERASALAESVLLLHPDHDVALAVRERAAKLAPGAGEPCPDPLLTVERAEAYAALGRVDRAVRVYRRLVFRRPSDPLLKDRLDELLGQPHAPLEDDLSEEIPHPDKVPPPSLKMPNPALERAQPKPQQQPSAGLAVGRVRKKKPSLPGTEDVAAELDRQARQEAALEADDEVTDITDHGLRAVQPSGEPRPARRDAGDGKRRRRSLLRK